MRGHLCVGISRLQQNGLMKQKMNSKYKNNNKSKKVVFFFFAFWSEREHMLSQTSLSLMQPEAAANRTQHKPTVFNQTTQAVKLFSWKKDEGKLP